MSDQPLLQDDPSTRVALRHVLATLAYRAGKAVRGTPDSFGDYRPQTESRSALEIVAHMATLMDWCLSMARGRQRWVQGDLGTWTQEIARFFNALAAFDAYLATDEPIRWDIGRMLQGGMADALTHAGQLTMMRRLAGLPMKGENYSKADIRPGRVGLDQTPADPAAEFE